MQKLSYLSVLGYHNALPSRDVWLPLKYSTKDVQIPPDDVWEKNIYSAGSFIELPHDDKSSFYKLGFGLSHDKRVVVLTPFDSHKGDKLQNLRFNLPNSVFSESTIALQYVSNGSSVEHLVIDLIDENYLFVTIKVDIECFLRGSDETRLSLQNFREWINISAPYSFELRSKPLVLRPLDVMNYIVSLEDGGLLHFRRKALLGGLDIFSFQNSQSLSLNIMSGLFGHKNKDKADDGVSSNAVIDAVPSSESAFITISLKRELQSWDLHLHKMISSQKISSELSRMDTLNLLSKRYLLRRDFGGLTFFFALDLTSRNWTELPLSPILKCFQISPQLEFLEWDIFKGTCDQLKTMIADHNVTGKVQVQDFNVISLGESSFMISILFRSNGLGYLLQQDINIHSKESQIRLKCAVEEEPYFLSAKASLQNELEVRKALESGRYDLQILEAALMSIKKSFITNDVLFDGPLTTDSILNCVNHIAVKNGITIYSVLSQILMVCEELRKRSQEPLSLYVSLRTSVVSQAHGMGIFRVAHVCESNPDDDKIMAILSKIQSRVSVNTLFYIQLQLSLTETLDKKVAQTLADTLLAEKFTEQEIFQFGQDLLSSPSALERLKGKIDCFSKDSTLIAKPSSIKSSFCPGYFEKAVFQSSLRVISTRQENFLTQVAVLFLLFDADEQVLLFLRAIHRNLRKIALVELLLNSKLLGLNVDPEKNDFFIGVSIWKVFFQKHPNISELIYNEEYNRAIDAFNIQIDSENFSDWVSKTLFAYLSCENFKVVEFYFASLLDSKNPTHTFLKAFIDFYNGNLDSFLSQILSISNLQEVFFTLRSWALQYLEKSMKLMRLFTSVSPGEVENNELLSIILHELASFAHELASETKANLHDVIKVSAALEKTAIDHLKKLDTNATKYIQLLELYHRKLLDRSLKIRQYEDAAECLFQLDSLVTRRDLKVLFSHFLRILLSDNLVNFLFEPQMLLRFSSYYSLVDRVLLEISNEDLLLSKALRCYETLYSWRLLAPTTTLLQLVMGDRRGAVEALYIFITRFRMEKEVLLSDSNGLEDFKQYKLKILELYMIILNCLLTFTHTEDRWFMRKSDDGLQVVTIDELRLEYNCWLRDLETEVA